MTWHICVFIFLFLSVITGLTQRKLGQEIPKDSRLINAFFFLFIHYPAGLITALIIGFDPSIGWPNFIMIVAFSITFPLAGFLSLRASKDVDAGLFSILQNLAPVVSIVLAVLLLSEHLTLGQFVGTLIIIASALTVSLASYECGSKNTKISIILALSTVVLVGVGAVYEKWMLGRIGFSSYLVYGWAFQTFWATVIAWPMLGRIKLLFRSKRRLHILVFSISRSMKGFAFVGALYLSQSASLVSAFVSFLPVLMVIAGFIVLHEKQYFKVKILSAVAGSAGLAMLVLSR